MGMDVLILHTAGRRSRQPYETHPGRAAIELPGGRPQPVAPQWLDGADRDAAWQRIVAANPRFAKYQETSDRQYPIVRLTPR